MRLGETATSNVSPQNQSKRSEARVKTTVKTDEELEEEEEAKAIMDFVLGDDDSVGDVSTGGMSRTNKRVKGACLIQEDKPHLSTVPVSKSHGITAFTFMVHGRSGQVQDALCVAECCGSRLFPPPPLPLPP